MPGACWGSEELLTVLTAGAQVWSAGSRARPSCSPHQGALAAARPISATSPPRERGMQGTHLGTGGQVTGSVQLHFMQHVTADIRGKLSLSRRLILHSVKLHCCLFGLPKIESPVTQLKTIYRPRKTTTSKFKPQTTFSIIHIFFAY